MSVWLQHRRPFVLIITIVKQKKNTHTNLIIIIRGILKARNEWRTGIVHMYNFSENGCHVRRALLSMLSLKRQESERNIMRNTLFCFFDLYFSDSTDNSACSEDHYQCRSISSIAFESRRLVHKSAHPHCICRFECVHKISDIRSERCNNSRSDTSYTIIYSSSCHGKIRLSGISMAATLQHGCPFFCAQKHNVICILECPFRNEYICNINHS